MIPGYVLLTVLCSTTAFNIFTKSGLRFLNNEKQFGQAMIPYKNGIVVATANLENRKLHYCTMEENCTEFIIKGETSTGLKPIVSAAKSLNGDQFLICQQVRRRISTNEDLNGECSLMSGPTMVTETLTPAAEVVKQMETKHNRHKGKRDVFDSVQRKFGKSSRNNNNNNNNNETEDPEDAGTEIAFVLDGSGSIDPPDFEIAKTFISNVMKKVWESCFNCNFAIVQYGHIVRPELLLNDNADSKKALDTVKKIKQITNFTITASAINYVLDHVFVPENGSNEKAAKMIIVLTDGEISFDNMSLTTVLNSTKIKNVTRFAIGVGNALSSKAAMKELKQIASEPYNKHLFMVNNYGALEDYLSQLEESITGLEGIQKEAAFLFNLAEAGFSSHLGHDGTLLFGAVGAFDWSGGMIVKDPKKSNMTFLNATSTGKGFSYLGYSVTSAMETKFSLYISGAPRHNLTGAVFVFVESSHKLMETLPGEQVGSYFGAELCALDINQDQKTDYLLVGAPFFHLKGEEGKVYIYKLEEGRFQKEDWELQGVDGYIFARFGSTITNIGDIDGNSFDDVAIGAPLEEKNDQSFGSIYIYNGYEGGIMRHFSQRISAADFEMNLRYFGQAVSRMSDQYLAVGSEGMVTILETVPVVQFNPAITLDPAIISQKEKARQISLKICFKQKRGGIKASEVLPVAYKVDLDAKQEKKRLYFDNGNPWIQGVIHLTYDKNCLDQMYARLKDCHDCFTPIEIKLSFQLEHTPANKPLRVLDMFSPTESSAQLLYEVYCNDRTVCVPQISLSNSSLSTDTILLGAAKNLILDIDLTNMGERSYLTNLILTYPDVLEFTKVSKRAGAVVCINEGRRSQLWCNISHPVLDSNAQADFSIFWHPVKETSVKALSISSVLTCENNGTQILDRKHYTFKLKKALRVQLTGKVNPSVLNVAEDKNARESFRFNFEIMGENKYDASIIVTINVTCSSSDLEMNFNHNAQKGPCTDNQKKDTYNIQCNFTTLPEHIVLEGSVLTGRTQQKDYITAKASISFDRELYEADEQVTYKPLSETLTINKLKVVRSVSAIIGGSIGGLLLLAIIIIILIKCGFFRKRYQENQKSRTELNDDCLDSK